MDPVAVFHHSDVSRECISERNWQKLNTDRASSFRFDKSGRYLAIYVNWNTIEIWDISSIPVPVSCLVLPKAIGNKFDGFCHALQWSVCSQQLVGVFGARSALKRKAAQAGAESDSTTVNDGLKGSYLIVWDIIDRRILHKYRLPFPVSSLSTIVPIGASASRSPYYILSSAAQSSPLLLVNVSTGTVQQISHIGALMPCGVLTDTSSGAETSEPDSFAQWWTQHISAGRGGELPPGREQLLPTASLCRDAELFIAFAATTQGTLASSGTSYSTLVHMEFALESTSGGHGPYDIRCHLLRSCTMPGHMLVQTLAYEEHAQLLSATSEKCGILLFSTRDGDLRLVSEHHPSDRDTADLLNAQSAGFNMRSAAKYHSAATRKLNTVLYGATATFRCTYSGFCTQTQPHGVDNTRFTNSLRPHTLLPVRPASTRRSDSSSALSAGSGGSGTKLGSFKQRQEQQVTSVLYCVQSTHRGGNASGAAPGSLIMWDYQAPSAGGNGRKSPHASSSAVANGHSHAALPTQSMRAISLPPGEIIQIEASPALPRGGGQSRPRGRFGHQPARQIVVCIDGAGSVHILRPQYKTDFPGPMYPIGYTLITKVIGYLEREDELDVLPGSADAIKGENGTIVSGTSVSNGSTGDIAVTAHASAQGSSYATVSDAASSGRSSVESLVGLQFLEEAALATHAAAPPTVLKTEGGATSQSADDAVDVSALVVASARHRKLAAPNAGEFVCLPFTFADDWLRYPAQPASAAASKSSELASPVRSLRDAGKLGLLSPQSPWQGSGELAVRSSSEAMEVADEDGAATEAGTSSSGMEVFSAGFETYLPAPTRVENGDFDGKLLRQRAAQEALKHTILEPHRVGEKLRQLQEEAVHGVYHAEALRVKRAQRQAAQKSQREEERGKVLQQQEQQRAQDAQRAAAQLQRMEMTSRPGSSLAETAEGQSSAGTLLTTASSAI